MSDYLTNLAHTLVHADTAVQPRRPARFEPARRTLPALSALAPVSVEPAQADDDAPTATAASDAAPAAAALPVHPPHRSTPAAGNLAPVERQRPPVEAGPDPAAPPPAPPASAAPAEDVRRAGTQAAARPPPRSTPVQSASSERSAAPARDEPRPGHADVEPRRPHIPPLANPAVDAVTARDSRSDDIASVPAPPSRAPARQLRRDRAAAPSRSPQPVRVEGSPPVQPVRATAAPQIPAVHGAAIRGIEPVERPGDGQPTPHTPAQSSPTSQPMPVRPAVHSPPRVAAADTTGSWGAANAAAQSAPTIHVTIGRVEVRATTPAASPAPAKPVRRKPTVSLDAYLARRNGGQS